MAFALTLEGGAGTSQAGRRPEGVLGQGTDAHVAQTRTRHIYAHKHTCTRPRCAHDTDAHGAQEAYASQSLSWGDT